MLLFTKILFVALIALAIFIGHSNSQIPSVTGIIKTALETAGDVADTAKKVAGTATDGFVSGASKAIGTAEDTAKKMLKFPGDVVKGGVEGAKELATGAEQEAKKIAGEIFGGSKDEGKEMGGEKGGSEPAQTANTN